MKRLAQPRTAGAVVALVIAVCLLLTSVSNAAGLSLVAQSGGAFAQTTGRCTNSTLDVEPSGAVTGGKFSQVTIEGNLGSCSGGHISIYSSTTPGEVVFAGTVTLTNGVAVANGSPFTPPVSAAGEAVLGLDGWLIPTRWTYTPPVVGHTCEVYRMVGGVATAQPGKSCTASVSSVTAPWGTVGDRQTNIYFSFAASGASHPDFFRVTINLDAVSLLPAGWTTSNSGTRGNNLYAIHTRCNQMPVFTFDTSPGHAVPPGGLYTNLVENRTGKTLSCLP